MKRKLRIYTILPSQAGRNRQKMYFVKKTDKRKILSKDTLKRMEYPVN